MRLPQRRGWQQEVMMSRKSDLLEEKQGIVHWLLDVLLGRLTATKEAIGNAIHRLGTVERRLKDDDG